MKALSTLLLIISSLLMLIPLATAQDVALGEAFPVGETWYPIQQTSSVGKMIARDADGGIHVTWTWSPNADGAQRHIYYGFADDDNGDLAEQFAEASAADIENRAGYSSLDLRQTEEGSVAALFFHGSSKGIAALDFAPGWGAFESFYFDPPGDVIPINSKGCIGSEGRMFLAAGVHNPMAGDPNFLLTVWPADPDGDGWEVGERAEPEQITGLSYALVASRTADPVALVWHHNLIGVPGDDDWAGRLEHQMNNDIRVVVAEDGRAWDWDNPFDITRTILPDPELEGIAALGDTLRPYADLDAIWVGEVLHVVFTARGFWADLEGNLVPPVERITINESFIWHWDSASDSLTLVADGWFENELEIGSFSGNVSKPSLGADAEGRLYCLFQKAIPADEAMGGYCYTDVCVAFSEDGSEWSEAVNLTDTHPRDGQRLEYVDERYCSLAERVDEDLHFSYLSFAEDDGNEHVARVTYHRVDVADLGDFVPLELPRAGFIYHNRGELAVEDEGSELPAEFSISEAFPNPFNSTTTIRIELPESGDVSIVIFDGQGREISNAKMPRRRAGVLHWTWNGRTESGAVLTSGVYLCSIKFNTIDGRERESKLKLTLLK